MITSAGSCAATCASAASPVSHQCGSKPSVRSAYCSVSAMPGSSSTIRMSGRAAIDGGLGGVSVVGVMKGVPGLGDDRAMLSPDHALAAAARVPPRSHAATRRVLVIGAHSALGWAVIEELSTSGRFERVATLVLRPIHAAFHGFVALNDDDAALGVFAADTAVVVFDRPRLARRQQQRGNDDVFVHSDPAALPHLARRLRAAGTRTLIVAMPHAPALMPAALQHGLATLDENEVASIGFEQLIFMRMAQQGGLSGSVAGEALSPPQRLANWMLSQLLWLVPRSEQPVRLATVAKVAAALTRLAPAASQTTRVLPSALLSQAAQTRHVDTLIQAWLDGAPLPDNSALPLPRM